MSYTTQYHDEEYTPRDDIQFELIVSRQRHLVDDDSFVTTPGESISPNIANVTNQADVSFVPRYYPERVIQDKERDLMREKGICLGEYVNDVGAINREFRVTGKIITPELREFHKLIDYGEKYHLICMQWEGEVLVKDSSLEGPIGVDVETKHWMYDYQLDLVSTGEDEQHQGDHGIIDRGNE